MISEAEVRAYLDDQDEFDNPVLAGDLAFTPEEIQKAMKSAAREYNSVKPRCHNVTADCLPDEDNIFFDAITAALLRRKLSSLSRNDVPYQAGNTAANHTATKIQHFTRLEKFYQDRFREAAFDKKLAMNLRGFYGSVGGTL